MKEEKRREKSKAKQEKTSGELLRYAFLVNLPGADPKACSVVYQNEECYCMVAGVDGAEMGKCFAQELLEQGYMAIDLGSDFPAEAVLQIREMAEKIDLARMAELEHERRAAEEAAKKSEPCEENEEMKVGDNYSEGDSPEATDEKTEASLAEIVDEAEAANEAMKDSAGDKENKTSEKSGEDETDSENGDSLVELADEACEAELADENDMAELADGEGAADEESKVSEEETEMTEDKEIKKIRIGHIKYTLDGLIALDFTRTFGKCGIIIVAGGVAQPVEMVLKNKKRDVHIAFTGNIRQAKSAAKKMLEKRVAYIELSYWFDRMRLDSVVRAVGGKIAVGTCGDLTMQDLVDYPSDEPIRVTVNDRKR